MLSTPSLSLEDEQRWMSKRPLHADVCYGCGQCNLDYVRSNCVSHFLRNLLFYTLIPAVHFFIIVTRLPRIRHGNIFSTHTHVYILLHSTVNAMDIQICRCYLIVLPAPLCGHLICSWSVSLPSKTPTLGLKWCCVVMLILTAWLHLVVGVSSLCRISRLGRSPWTPWLLLMIPGKHSQQSSVGGLGVPCPDCFSLKPLACIANCSATSVSFSIWTYFNIWHGENICVPSWLLCDSSPHTLSSSSQNSCLTLPTWSLKVKPQVVLWQSAFVSSTVTNPSARMIWMTYKTPGSLFFQFQDELSPSLNYSCLSRELDSHSCSKLVCSDSSTFW